MKSAAIIKLVTALAAAVAMAAPPVAQARPGGVTGGVAVGPSGGSHGNWSRGGGYWGHGGGYWGHSRGYWGPGPFWGGFGLGLGFGVLAYSAPWYGGYYAYPGYYGYPAGDYIVEPGERTARPAGQPVPSAAPDPIFYPKNAQTPAQTEADRQDCNRWATTQPGAMSDASIFQRATFACMEGRGYTVK